LEFLREVTGATVGTDSSKFEPVNVSSLKVVELEASGLGASNLSGASKRSVVLDTVRSLIDFLSVPELEAGVRERVPLKDNLLSNSRLDSRLAEGSRSTSQLNGAGQLGARKTTSILVAGLSSDSDVTTSSEVEGSSLERSHGNLAGFSGSSLGEVNLTTSLSRQVAESLVSTLRVHDLKVVASDTRTTVGRSGPVEGDIASVRYSGEAHRSGSGSQFDRDGYRPRSPSARVGGTDLEGVRGLRSGSKSYSSRELPNVVSLAVLLASSVNALLHLVRGSSSDSGVSQSDTVSTLVDDSK